MKAKKRTGELIESVRLGDVLKSVSRPRYVLGTTYTLSLAFFESTVFPLFDRAALKACVIVCDTFGYSRALDEASALHGAGQDYIVAPAPIPDCFHAKVWIVANADEAVLLVGSGNLTQAGFMTNAEFFDVIRVSKLAPADAVLMNSIRSFVRGLAGMWSSDTSAPLCVEALAEIETLLAAIPTAAASNTATERFIHSFDGAVVDQLPSIARGADLFVAAPYFGGGISGLKLLEQRYPHCRLRIFPAVHSEQRVDVPTSRLREMTVESSTACLRVPNKGDSFAHLKLYGAAKERSEAWIFCTSANCTSAALRGPSVEAGILRDVTRSALTEYFTATSAVLPNDLLAYESNSSYANVLALSASDTGSALNVVVAANSEKHLPLSNVTLTVRAGTEFRVLVRPILFEHGRSVYVSWHEFPEWERPRRNALRLDISATGRAGETLRGSCFIENQLLLSSEPEHRSAWRGALAMLETEGVPELADLAAVFALARDVFGGELVVEVPSGASRSGDKGEANDPVGIAIWPPQPDVRDVRAHAGRTATGQVKWFQQIMKTLLRTPKQFEPAAQNDDDSDSGDDDPQIADDPHRLEQQEHATTLAERLWSRASRDYETLCLKLQEFVPSHENARNVWPVAIFTFLATMAIFRTARRISQGVKLGITANVLVDDFIRLMLAERTQAPDFCPPKGFRYQGEKFPPLADDLATNFSQLLPPDLTNVMIGLLADKKMREEPEGFRTLWANRMRQICGPEYAFTDEAVGEIRSVWRRFLCEDISEDNSLKFDSALNFLRELLPT